MRQGYLWAAGPLSALQLLLVSSPAAGLLLLPPPLSLTPATAAPERTAVILMRCS